MKRHSGVSVFLILASLFLTQRSQAASQPTASPVEKGSQMENFKKPSDDELKKKLTREQYEVTQHESTEAPFRNAYWDNKRAGIYVDVVSGEPLFSSLDKYDSGTGWPSFSRPLESANLTTKEDRKFQMKRTEVRSKNGDSHLGHLFEGEASPTGLRYCMNSASMRFIPVEKLKEEGYEKYLALFAKPEGAAPAKEGKTEKSAKDVKQKPVSRAVATLAGGCFWGMEDLLRKQPGVLETRVGYTGGLSANPTYEKVKKGDTGHAESIEITFDPSKTNYEEILRFYFKIHDPTTLNRQGNDIGTQYRSAIFYHDEEQKRVAEKVKREVDQSGKWKKPVVTEIAPASEFYSAEDYHQDYLVKNPGGYTCHFIRD